MGIYILFLTVTVLQRLGETSKAVGVEGDEDQRKRMVSLLNRNKKALQSSVWLSVQREGSHYRGTNYNFGVEVKTVTC